MIGRTNAGGGGLGKSTLIVQTETGSTVTVTKGTETKTARESYGVWAFPGLAAGDWTVKAVKDGKTATKTVTMDGTNSAMVTVVFSVIPAFTYTGDYETTDDNGNPITASLDNWNIRLLTSGTLRFQDLRGAVNGVDVFNAGGGGGGALTSYAGGGGGGYCGTDYGLRIKTNTDYVITIGAGGAPNTDGGTTSGIGTSRSGGKRGNDTGIGGNGGSGGGGSGFSAGANGGSDGGNGENGAESAAGGGTKAGGTGQGTTTKSFGTGAIYCNGGGGAARSGSGGSGGGSGSNKGGNGASSADKIAGSAQANSGSGGGGASNWVGSAVAGSGGSGIVIIRNKR